MKNKLSYKFSYRRRLPHIQPEGATFFVTSRLAGSLPSEVNALDMSNSGIRYLAEPSIADLVSESLHYRDGKVYELIAFNLVKEQKDWKWAYCKYDM